jgi:hypothetical protein
MTLTRGSDARALQQCGQLIQQRVGQRVAPLGVVQRQVRRQRVGVWAGGFEPVADQFV